MHGRKPRAPPCWCGPGQMHLCLRTTWPGALPFLLRAKPRPAAARHLAGLPQLRSPLCYGLVVGAAGAQQNSVDARRKLPTVRLATAAEALQPCLRIGDGIHSGQARRSQRRAFRVNRGLSGTALHRKRSIEPKRRPPAAPAHHVHSAAAAQHCGSSWSSRRRSPQLRPTQIPHPLQLTVAQ